VPPEPPTTRQLAELFGSTAATYDKVIPFFATFGARLVELAGVSAGEEVLDVAAGRGASLFPAAERVGPQGRVVGIDLAPAMVELLGEDVASRELTNATVTLMDAEDIVLPAASFDVVLCGFTLWLLPHPDRAAAGFSRVLRPGGRVAVSAPTGAGPAWDFFAPLVQRFAEQPAAAAAPPANDMADALAGAGFTDLEVLDETAHFAFADEHAWWEWAWSTGMRGAILTVPPEARDQLRAAALDHVRTLAGPDGIPLDQGVRFVLARRPLSRPD
jgi:O-methyltransferase/aklanonic acid methyltransferase